MINPTWLKTFCTLAEVGHFTHTADKLFMTQSGVSQHIKKLEADLETPLIIRDGKSFHLSVAGKRLYCEGQKLLRAGEQLEQLIKQDDPHIGQVNIASPGSVGLKLYPYLLDLQLQFPHLIINYAFAPNKSIETDINEGKYDIGLLTSQSNTNNIYTEQVTEEDLVVVTQCNVPEVNWAVLQQLGFISHPDGSHQCHLLLGKNFPEFEHSEQFIQKGFSNQISLILEPVSRGLGFTVLPLYAVKAFYRQDLIKIHRFDQSVAEKLFICQKRQTINSNRVTFIKEQISRYFLKNTHE